MIVRKLRLRRDWSQNQLAGFTGVTVRSIQRIERGHKPSLEYAKEVTDFLAGRVAAWCTRRVIRIWSRAGHYWGSGFWILPNRTPWSSLYRQA